MRCCRRRWSETEGCASTLHGVAPTPAPRTWLENPDDFGRVTKPPWRDDEDAASPAGIVGVEAAKLQHEIALFVRRSRGTKGWDSWAAVADNLPLDVREWQLRSIMRGESHMSLRHITALQVGFPHLIHGPFQIRAMTATIDRAKALARERH